jgi:hypothetical protein
MTTGNSERGDRWSLVAAAPFIFQPLEHISLLASGFRFPPSCLTLPSQVCLLLNTPVIPGRTMALRSASPASVAQWLSRACGRAAHCIRRSGLSVAKQATTTNFTVVQVNYGWSAGLDVEKAPCTTPGEGVNSCPRCKRAPRRSAGPPRTWLKVWAPNRTLRTKRTPQDRHARLS